MLQFLNHNYKIMDYHTYKNINLGDSNSIKQLKLSRDGLKIGNCVEIALYVNKNIQKAAVHKRKVTNS